MSDRRASVPNRIDGDIGHFLVQGKAFVDNALGVLKVAEQRARRNVADARSRLGRRYRQVHDQAKLRQGLAVLGTQNHATATGNHHRVLLHSQLVKRLGFDGAKTFFANLGEDLLHTLMLAALDVSIHVNGSDTCHARQLARNRSLSRPHEPNQENRAIKLVDIFAYRLARRRVACY